MRPIFVTLWLCSLALAIPVAVRDLAKSGTYQTLLITPSDNDRGLSGLVNTTLCSYDRPHLQRNLDICPPFHAMAAHNHRSSMELDPDLGTLLEAHPQDAEEHRLVATDGGLSIIPGALAISDHFAFSVAINDYWAIVPSLLEAAQPGALYIYQRDGEAWTIFQKVPQSGGLVGALPSFDPEANPWAFVSKPGFNRIDMDREWFFVGNSRETAGGYVDVCRFGDITNDQQLNPTWFNQQVLRGDGDEDEAFGTNLDAWGNYLLVGANEPPKALEGGPTVTDSGAIYVYRQDYDAQWSRVQKLTRYERNFPSVWMQLTLPTDSSPAGTPFRADLNQGETFSNPRIHEDRAAVGAFRFGNETTGYCSGRVYLYSLARSTESLAYAGRFLDLYDNPGRSNTANTTLSFFGYGMALVDDWLVVGAPGPVQDSLATAEIAQRGRVLFYHWNGTAGSYTFVQEEESPDGHVGDSFGQSVSCDGLFCAVMAPRNYNPGSGQLLQGMTYVYELDPIQLSWTLMHSLAHGNPLSLISMGSNQVITPSVLSVTGSRLQLALRRLQVRAVAKYINLTPRPTLQISAVHYPWLLAGSQTLTNPFGPDEGAGSAQIHPLRPTLFYEAGPAPGSDFFCYNTTSEADPDRWVQGVVHVQLYLTPGEGNGDFLMDNNAVLGGAATVSKSDDTARILAFVSIALAAVAIALILWIIFALLPRLRRKIAAS